MASVDWEEFLWSADLQACCQRGPVDSVIIFLFTDGENEAQEV